MTYYGYNQRSALKAFFMAAIGTVAITSSFTAAFWASVRFLTGSHDWPFRLVFPVVGTLALIVAMADGVSARLFNRFRRGFPVVTAIWDGFFAMDRKRAAWGPWYWHRD